MKLLILVENKAWVAIAGKDTASACVVPGTPWGQTSTERILYSTQFDFLGRKTDSAAPAYRVPKEAWPQKGPTLGPAPCWFLFPHLFWGGWDLEHLGSRNCLTLAEESWYGQVLLGGGTASPAAKTSVRKQRSTDGLTRRAASPPRAGNASVRGPGAVPSAKSNTSEGTAPAPAPQPSTHDRAQREPPEAGGQAGGEQPSTALPSLWPLQSVLPAAGRALVTPRSSQQHDEKMGSQWQ